MNWLRRIVSQQEALNEAASLLRVRNLEAELAELENYAAETYIKKIKLKAQEIELIASRDALLEKLTTLQSKHDTLWKDSAEYKAKSMAERDELEAELAAFRDPAMQPSQRYWEARWRDTDAELDELKRQLDVVTNELMALKHTHEKCQYIEHGFVRMVEAVEAKCPPDDVLAALHGLMDRHDFPMFNQQHITRFMWGALDRIVLSLAKWKASKTEPNTESEGWK